MAYLLTHLLADAARRTPDKTAIRCRGRELTYARLEELSSHLAGLLRDRGVNRGDRVGLLLPKSLEQVIALFGVLKCGSAYVPLDPFWPAARSSYMVKDCGLRALLGTPELLARFEETALPPLTQVAVPIPEEGEVNWRAIEAASPSVCQTGIEQDLAYILYTSGSTGRPKGVAINHRASLSFVQWAGDCFAVTENDHLSNHAPLHFDLSVFDLFSGLRAGATTVLVPEEFSSFPRNLLSFLQRECITIWYSVPSALIRMLDAGLAETELEALRTVLFAGEVFPAKHLARLLQSLPQCRLFNLFGPTETNVCTYHEVKKIPDEKVAGSVIGKPCANTDVWIETEEGHIARPGQPGELIVRGPSLMTGYWNRPEETAQVLRRERAEGIEQCVYHTGDWALRSADGNLVFLGRRDHLVKLRGYRIELGEIEAVLHRCESVREAAVLAHSGLDSPEPEIVAFASPTDPSVEISEVKEFCSQQLPRYMVPSRFLFLESLPRTSTGKLDRESLSQYPSLKPGQSD